MLLYHFSKYRRNFLSAPFLFLLLLYCFSCFSIEKYRPAFHKTVFPKIKSARIVNNAYSHALLVTIKFFTRIYDPQIPLYQKMLLYLPHLFHLCRRERAPAAAMPAAHTIGGILFQFPNSDVFPPENAFIILHNTIYCSWYHTSAFLPLYLEESSAKGFTFSHLFLHFTSDKILA